MVEAELAPGPGGAVANRTVLFELSPSFVIDQFHTSFYLTPDGRSFVFRTTSTNSQRPGEGRLVLVQHWFTELRELMKKSK